MDEMTMDEMTMDEMTMDEMTMDELPGFPEMACFCLPVFANFIAIAPA